MKLRCFPLPDFLKVLLKPRRGYQIGPSNHNRKCETAHCAMDKQAQIHINRLCNIKALVHTRHKHIGWWVLTITISMNIQILVI